MNELGVPNYDELVLVAQGERLEEDPEELRLFIGALAKGTDGRGRRPAGGDRGRARGRRRPGPRTDPRRGRRHPAAAGAHAGRALRPYGRRGVGACSPSWMAENGLISERARDRGRAHQRAAARAPRTRTRPRARRGASRQRRALGDRLAPADQREGCRPARGRARRARSTPRPPRRWRGGRGPPRWPTSFT